MYNTQIKCTYQNLDNGSEVDLDLAENKYREEFLQVFGVDDFCDDTVNTIIQGLNEKIVENEKMITLLKKLASTFMSEDPDIGLMVGFSYHYFFLMHPCICDLLESGSISQENFNALKLEVENNLNIK
jgi:hypothetical protein